MVEEKLVTIKIRNSTRWGLMGRQRCRETYSDIIERLLHDTQDAVNRADIAESLAVDTASDLHNVLNAALHSDRYKGVPIDKWLISEIASFLKVDVH